MRILFLPLLTSFIFSCSAQAPKEDEVKEMVRLWYMQQSSGDGAGTWTVNGVTVLSIKENKYEKDIFNTISIVSGVYHPPMPGTQWAEPKADRKFNDTLKMDLRWNGARWVTAD